ncbi:hypothetical protein AUI46_03845 [archaeon 13_1_40CM_2_52_13]|nr:MAG: hypothetical protein AUI46_03845 [archaeon 13_1_40CM_2_52_13]
MRIRVLLKFAKILMLSRLRNTRESFLSNSITNRPILIALIGSIMFAAGVGFGTATVSFLRGAGASPADIGQIVETIFGGIPIFLIGFFFTMGLLWELNASSESESADSINWLPISPSEYVFASTLSTSYTYSPLVLVTIGYSLPIGILTGNTSAFFVLVVASVVAAFIGSVTVEILRSLLAHASTAFNKVGGRSMIALRILGVILILLFAQTLFSGFLIIRIINSVSSANAATVLVPLLWPTLSITSILRSNLLSSAYFLLLSLGFLAVLASSALALRSKSWVATPPSFHFSNTGTISRVSRLRKIGVSVISLALVRREIRSATRRKEMVRLMAIPIILPVMISFPALFSPAPTTSAASGLISPLFLAVPLLFGVGLGTLFLGMTSIGQEGKRLWNLSSLPLEAGTIVTSKILFTSLISTIGLVLGLGLTVFFFQVSIVDAMTFVAVGITLVLAEASLGVAIGSRYPDFSDGPRPRFVTIIGSIIGAFLGVMVMLLMSLPLLFLLFARVFLLLPFSLQLSFFLGGMLGLIFARISYSLSIRSVDGILRELPN